MRTLLSLLPVLSLLFTSCATIFATNSRIDIETEHPNTRVHILKEDGFEEILPENRFDYKISNVKRMAVFKQEKDGYLTLVEVVEPNQKNIYRRITLAQNIISFSAWMYAGSEIHTPIDELSSAWLAAPILTLTGVYGNLLHPSGKKIFGKTLYLPPIQAYPQLQTGGNQLALNTVNIDIAKTNLSASFFASYKHYLKNRAGKEVFAEDEIYIEETIFQDLLRYRLGRTGYIDTTTKIYAQRFVDLGLDANLKKAEIQIMDDILRITGEIEWILSDQFSGETLFRIQEEAKSNWSWHNNDTSKLNNCLNESLASLFEVSMRSFLIQPQTQRELMRTTSAFGPEFDSWQPLILARGPKAFTNAPTAAEAVVTVFDEFGHGSGVVIGSDGYIISNHHVVRDAIQKKKGITVRLNDGTEYEAQVLRSNPIFDLALLKIDGHDLPCLHPSSLRKVIPGDDIFAIGTPSDMTLGQTVSAGIISAKRVDQERVAIQTDVSINAGNSGGALLNKKGDLLGIINAKLVGVGIEGIGFAVPAEYIEQALKVYFTN